MSCLLRVKQRYDLFTKKEKMVADYILQYPQEMLNLSVREIAERAGSSTGAVIRLVKKLNYEGYHQMKIALAKSDRTTREKSFLIQQEDDANTIASTIASSTAETLSEILHAFPYQEFRQASEKLKNAETVYLLGAGASAIVAADLHQKLLRLHVNTLFHTDLHIQISTSVFAGPNDVVLAFSYSGETREVNAAAQNAKRNGAYIIAVTRSRKSPLSSLCDFPCFLPNNEGEFRLGAITSRNAQFFISDLLYLTVAQKDFLKTEERIIKTREAVKNSQK